MSLCLAATWNPRGELERFLRLLPQLECAYNFLAVILPPVTKNPPLSELAATHAAQSGRLIVKISPTWPEGRYLSLKTALDTPVSHIHYADMDRLLRWAETRPEEWQQAVQRVQTNDAVIFGRTPAAYATHPQALIQTEALSNRVVSLFLSQPMDVSAGSKGFSRKAATYLIANSRPERAIGADATWPIMLHRAGFPLIYQEVNGLDWESADRYRTTAADIAAQQQAAAVYDADPQHWAHRVSIAQEIISCAFEAAANSSHPTPTFNL
jgi:hypothetical protein